MIYIDTNDARRIKRMGFHVVRIDQPDMRIGAVVSQYALAVIDPRTDRQVAYARCTRQAEYLGVAWVEDADGVRTELRKFGDLLTALEAIRPPSRWMKRSVA